MERVIQAILTNNIAPLAIIVAVKSLITLYYYLKISYSRFIILNLLTYLLTYFTYSFNGAESFFRN
jgi:NADH:ubiquinone oxidoreductase subunit 2 (subunit N)